MRFLSSSSFALLLVLFGGRVEAETAAENLIGNPGFESVAPESRLPGKAGAPIEGDLIGWRVERGAAQRRRDGGHTGEHYIRIADESVSDTHLLKSRHIAARPGGQYSASVWVRTEDQGGPGIYLNFYNSSGVRIQSDHARAEAPTAGWVRVDVAAAAPPQAASVNVDLYSFLKDVGAYDFDDAALSVQGGAAPFGAQRIKPSIAEPVVIGSRRELFVDRFLIDGLDNARLELHSPRDEGPVLFFDKPWEGPFCAYCTVLQIGDRRRVYYRGRQGVGRDGDRTETTCIAESKDGIEWTRPSLGLYELDGSRDNNVVLANLPPFTHNFSPFLDARPGVDSDERFKAICGLHPQGLGLLVSADGLKWRMKREQIITSQEFAFDSQASAFWSATEQCYVCYFRTWKNKTRWVSRATSDDCLAWSAPAEMQTDAPLEHFYTNQTHPYFRAPHLYVSLPARFVPRRQVLTDQQARAIGVDPKYFKDTSDALFVTSRGGDRFDREFLTSFIRPGIGAENWVSRTNYPALNLARTGPHEMSVYVNQNYAQATAHLRRYSLRLDGFASVRVDAAGGELLTRPLVFSGRELAVNFSTSAAGGVRVEIQTASGEPIPGFRLFECREQIGNEIERQVTWDSAGDLASLQGKPVRLRFVLKDADLFAFQFRENASP